MGQVGTAADRNGRTYWTALQRFFGSDIRSTEKNSDAKQQGLPKRLPMMPLGTRLALAFEALPPSQTEKLLIEALMQQPGADSKTLSAACGWRSPIWHTHFGLMCQKRAAWLWPADLPNESGSQFLLGVLANYHAMRGSFWFKPEVETAFRKMGFG